MFAMHGLYARASCCIACAVPIAPVEQSASGVGFDPLKMAYEGRADQDDG